jgi:hypothetical protein
MEDQGLLAEAKDGEVVDRSAYYATCHGLDSTYTDKYRLKRMPHRGVLALGLGLTLLVIALATTQANRALPGSSLHALAADRPSETMEKALRERAALLAPLLHPQLYTGCESVAAPQLEQPERFYKSQFQEVRRHLATLHQGRLCDHTRQSPGPPAAQVVLLRLP